MKLEDIVKQKGLEIEKEEKKAKPSSSPSNLGRRYFWDEEAPEEKPPKNLLMKHTKKIRKTYEEQTKKQNLRKRNLLAHLRRTYEQTY